MSKFNVSRRQFLKIGGGAAAAVMMSRQFKFMRAFAATQGPGLSDPAMQPKFANLVPNALDPGFIYDTSRGNIKVAVGQTVQQTGLVAPDGVTPVSTTVWGYGDNKFYTWPGRTFQVRSFEPLEVKWENKLGGLPYLITGKDNTSLGYGDYTGRSVVDTNLHWAYSLHGYESFTIDKNGVPIVPHVHGGHSDFQFDGNPEFFFSPNYTIRGPQWVDKKYLYQNDQPAGTVWYHDHALGITRLNVYTGMAGFYIIRDDDDTGLFGNPLDLPAFPYEAAFAIQDRMFKDNGEFFYPAFPGDPFYEDFITGEGANLPPDLFPGGGPTGLATAIYSTREQLPIAPSKRMRQPLPGCAVLRGAPGSDRFQQRYSAARLYRRRERSGSGFQSDNGRYAVMRNGLAVRYHLRFQECVIRQPRNYEEYRRR